MEKFNADFQKVSDLALLGRTKRGHDGFGSTGVEVINKKSKQSQTDDEETENVDHKIVILPLEDKIEANSEKTDDDLVITSDRGTMSANGKIIIGEKIILDE